MAENWSNIQGLPPRKYVCGVCERLVAAHFGYPFGRPSKEWWIYICPNCARPTFFIGSEQYPAPLLGSKVDKLPEDIAQLYLEARRCTAAQAYTGCIMLCRKLLMNIAVEKGAKEGLGFAAYVEYLGKEGYIPPDGKPWVTRIKDKGNEANHVIKLMTSQSAEELLTFLSMLLKFVYEFPGIMQAKPPPSSSGK